MKRVLLIFALIGMLGSIAFAGPFAAFDMIIPGTQTPSIASNLTFGFKDSGLTAAFVISDLFATPALGLTATLESNFGWWASEFNLAIANIDVVTNYPLPVVDGVRVGWLGTLRLGNLPLVDGSVFTPRTLDIYGGVDFALSFEDLTLTPTGKIGFYWEL